MTKENVEMLLNANEKGGKNMKKKMANRFEPTIKNEEENNMNGIYEMATGAHAWRNEQIEAMYLPELLDEVEPERFVKRFYENNAGSWLDKMKGLVGEAVLGRDESEYWQWRPEEMADRLENILKEILKIENDIERDGYINVMIYLVDYQDISLECNIYEFLRFVNDEYEI